MSLSSTVNRVSYTGINSGATYNFPYLFFNDADLIVNWYDTVAGSTYLQVLNTDYTISGTKSNGVYLAGANIVVNSALPTTFDVVITRAPSPVQNFILGQNGVIPSVPLTQEFDYLALLIQREHDLNTRSVRLADGVVASNFDPTLPIGIAFASNCFLVVNSAGTGWTFALNQGGFGPTGYPLIGNGSSQISTYQQLDLGGAGITGTVAATHGGTGTTSFSTGRLVYAVSSTQLGSLVSGSSGYVLNGNGSGVPYWAAISIGSGLVSAGNITGILPIANGGTGQGSASSAITALFSSSALLFNGQLRITDTLIDPDFSYSLSVLGDSDYMNTAGESGIVYGTTEQTSDFTGMAVLIRTGRMNVGSSSSKTGGIEIVSGDDRKGSGGTGVVLITTGDSAFSATGPSGAVNIETGDSNLNSSGEILIRPGTPNLLSGSNGSGGDLHLAVTRTGVTNPGRLRFTDGSEGTIGNVLKSVDTSGRATWGTVGNTSLPFPIILQGSGSASAPGLTFVNNQSNGIYLVGLNNWGLSVGGTEAIDLKTSTGGGNYGNVGMGGAASVSDLFPLYINRSLAGTVQVQVNNPNTGASSGSKIQVQADNGNNTMEISAFTAATAAPDIYAGGRGVVRAAGSLAGITMVADASNSSDIKVYAGGDAIGNRILTVNSGGISVGVSGTSNGIINVCGGSSGAVAITAQGATGSFNFVLPSTAGAAGQALTSQGGTAAMTWTTVTTQQSTAAGLIALWNGPNPLLAISPIALENMLVNAAFDVWQALPTGSNLVGASATYFADQWYGVSNALLGGSVANFSRTTGALPGSFYGLKGQHVTTSGTAAAFEVWQTLDNQTALSRFVGQSTISFACNILALGQVNQVGVQFFSCSGEVRASNGGGGLTVQSSITSEQTFTVNSNTWTFSGTMLFNPTYAAGSNGVVGIRIRPTAVQSAQLAFASTGFIIEQCMLSGGIGAPGAFKRRTAAPYLEFNDCLRFYEKSYDPFTAIATVTNNGAVGFTSNGGTYQTAFFKGTKRVAPTITYYSPGSGASGKCRDFTVVGDQPITNTGVGTNTEYNTVVGSAAHVCSYHWVADARL